MARQNLLPFSKVDREVFASQHPEVGKPHGEEVRDRFIETPGTHFSRTQTSLSPAPNSLTKMIHSVNGQQRHGHRSSGSESGFEQLSSDGWNKDRRAFGDKPV